MIERLHISLPDDLIAWLKSVSKHEGRSMSNFIMINLYAVQEDYDKEENNARLELKELQSLIQPPARPDHTDPI